MTEFGRRWSIHIQWQGWRLNWFVSFSFVVPMPCHSPRIRLSLFKLQLWKITKWFQVLKIGSFWGVVNHNIDGRSHLSIGHHQHGPICYRDAFVEVRLLAGSASWNAVSAWALVAIWNNLAQASNVCNAPTKSDMILSLPPTKNGVSEQGVVAKDMKRRWSDNNPIRLLSLSLSLSLYRFIEGSF